MIWRKVPVVLALAAFAGCGGSGAGDAAALRPLVAGDAAPEYRAPALQGEDVDVRGASGAVLLNVWATWCVPCREEMPELQAVHEELAAAGLRVVAVSIDGAGAEAEVRRFLGDHGITFTVVHDAAERVTRAFRTVGVPETFLLAGGRVVKRWRGPVTQAGVVAEVRSVL